MSLEKQTLRKSGEGESGEKSKYNLVPLPLFTLVTNPMSAKKKKKKYILNTGF